MDCMKGAVLAPHGEWSRARGSGRIAQMDKLSELPDQTTGSDDDKDKAEVVEQAERPREIGGRDGPDPTRYGDWEKNGRCIDF